MCASRVGQSQMQIVCAVSMHRMICLVLGVNLLPDINLASVRPTCRVVLRHKPERWEVADVRSCAQATLYTSVCEVHLVRAFDSAADHLHVALLSNSVLDASSDELSVADERRLLLTLGSLRGESLPCGAFACAVVPYAGVRQRVVFAVELVGEAKFVLLCAVSLELSRHAHVAVHLVGVYREAFAGFGVADFVLIPLAVAVD